MAKHTETCDMTRCTTLLAKKPNTSHDTIGTSVKTMWYMNDDEDMFIPSLMFPLRNGIQEITTYITRLDANCTGVDEAHTTTYWNNDSESTWAQAGITFTTSSPNYKLQKDQYFTNTAVIDYSNGGEEIAEVTLFNFNPSRATWEQREYCDTETFFMINNEGHFIGPKNYIGQFDTVWFAPMPFINDTIGTSQSCCPLESPSMSLDDIDESIRTGVAVLTPDRAYSNIRAPRRIHDQYSILYFANINGESEQWYLHLTQTDEEESGDMKVAKVTDYALDGDFNDWAENLEWQSGTDIQYPFFVDSNECALFLIRSDGYVGWYDCYFGKG